MGYCRPYADDNKQDDNVDDDSVILDVKLFLKAKTCVADNLW